MPVRDRTDARISFGQRIGPKPVGAAGPPQAERLDKAPDAKDESDEPDQKRRVRIAEPISDFPEENGNNKERDNPPAAPVAVVQPLDRGGGIGPYADGE
jgi:hypothetical protein